MGKKCNRCKQEKPFSEFSKDRRVPDGYSRWCKKCMAFNLNRWKKNNPEKYKMSRMKDCKRRSKTREKALLLLSNGEKPKCAVCGFSDDIRFLQIDHIKNDGNKERRKLSGNSDYTQSTYRKILKMSRNKALKKYRILCVVHNWIKRYGLLGEQYVVVKNDK